jgi:pSer/pThr/pTyr-binding forkhead associated (FHA) protein
MAARLEISEGQFAGRTWDIASLGSFTVGRGHSNDVAIPDKGVSRQHCRIDFDGEHYWLVDCDSHNGTYLNGRRATNAMLYSGDVVRVGHTSMTFHNDTAGQ